MAYIRFLFVMMVLLTEPIYSQTSVRFTPFASQRFVNESQHAQSYVFIDAVMMLFMEDGSGSGAVSELGPVATKSVRDAYFYPNPFSLSSGTTLGYELSEDMDIQIRVYNMMGNEIYKDYYASGTQGGLGRGSGNVYNRIPFNASTFGYPLSSGVYFFVLMSGKDVLHRGKFAVKPR
jgi:hypothetical protein